MLADQVLPEPVADPVATGEGVRKPPASKARPWAPRGRHPGYTPRTSSGLAAYERALIRAGLAPVAGIDEAGRGACAGPLVVAAVMLHPDGRTSVPGLADSKELLPAAREEVYRILVQAAFTWHVVVIPPQQIDRLGLHVCNVTGMRRALAGLRCRPGFALTDGFPVRGLGVPSLAMWKGDQVAACVAAASILAKVTRDRIMTDLDEMHPLYGFARHKGYCTPDHKEALMDHGPCPSHRFSYVNVIEAVRARGATPPVPPQAPAGDDERSAFGDGQPAFDDERPALATRAIGIG
jgi:ribonuclease HII